MDTPTTSTDVAIGKATGGGFATGIILVDDRRFLLITAPKTEGYIVEAPWNGKTKRVEGALSYFDGLANTRAMAEAGSKVAQQVIDLRIGGFDDWYIPSRDELELCYRAFKPTAEENWVYRNGENPSSVPPGYPYTAALPAQTSVQLFRADGSKKKSDPAPATEAFEPKWHWSSTQYEGAAGYAWIQYFAGGTQYHALKGHEYLGRAVRRVAL